MSATEVGRPTAERPVAEDLASAGAFDADGVQPPARAVAEAVTRAFDEDVLALGDLTASLVPASVYSTLAIVTRSPGVIAGQRCGEAAFALMDDDLDVRWLRPDGSRVLDGDVVAVVSGRLRSILTAERTAINFLSHLSGVATLTRQYVDAVVAVNPGVRIIDTRKTTPGLRALEKAAVRAGGGRNHRASLSDAVLVKDNHLGGLSITEAVAIARDRWPGRLVEVECDREDQVVEACRAGATGILLDNMSPDEAGRCAALIRRTAAGPVMVEVSGRMRVDTVAAYAAAGVDVISVGALTHSAPALDLGLDLYDAGEDA